MCSILGNNGNTDKEGSSSSSHNSGSTIREFQLVEDVPKLKYTEKAFRESMRLYPPAWGIGRQAINDYKVSKYVIPAGSVIFMSQYVMHLNPRYYSDPDIFYPDRWSKESNVTAS